MLTAYNIHFCFQKRPIVDAESLELKPGELTALIGPNGAGKSTFLKIIAGELPCQRGIVNYNGKSLKSFSAKSLAKVRAVMPQHSQLSFPFKAIEVVELGLLALGKSYVPNLLEEVMAETHTLHLKDKLYSELSGGEKQRIQLSRVLVQIWQESNEPRYLLLDEPTSSLDIAHQHQVLHLASNLKHRNIGVLAVLHDLNMAAAYADQVVAIKKGSVYKSGKTSDIMTGVLLQQIFDYPIAVSAGTDHLPPLIHSLPLYHQTRNYLTA
jgi:iron complex transport system ATP-binding protein